MSKRKFNLKWYVYVHNFNGQKIEKYNIFDHSSFAEDVKKLCKEDITKDEFSKRLRRSLSYYFWSKCEWETVITSWPPRIDKAELDRLNAEYEDNYERYGHYPHTLCVRPEVGEKIDVYDQVRLNWDVFVNYCWNNK